MFPELLTRAWLSQHSTVVKLLVAPDGRTLPVFNETWRADPLRHLEESSDGPAGPEADRRGFRARLW